MAYQPAGNLTSSPGAAHQAAVYYKKKGLDRLEKKFRFREICQKDMVPKQEGRTVQFYRYRNFAANTTPTVEGTVGTSLALGSNTVQATVSQYTSFISVSDLAEDTFIDPVVANSADLLGYQAGLSVDTMTRNVIDAQSGSTNQALLNSVLRVDDLRAARHYLQSLDVEPMDSGFYSGWFAAIVHPFASFDLVNDPAAGGLADIVKYTAPKDSALVKYEDRGTVTHVASCKVVESTNVFTQTTPNRYRAYVFGKGAIGAVDLAGRGPSDVVDPSKQRFKIRVIRPTGNEISDPEGVIGAAVAYNFVFTSLVLDGPAGIGGTYRYRTLDPISTLG